MADDDKPKQAETTQETQTIPLRQLVIQTDGARVEIPFCTMSLWEKKAILEAVLTTTNAEIQQAAQGGQAPQAPPAAEPAEAEEPAKDAVDG